MEQQKLYLEITNKGLIENDALTLLGGSTKRDDEDTIGFFGSGNKFALAFAMRKKLEIKIFSGAREIVIGTKEVTFKDKTFEKITVDGIEKDITTEFGPQWKHWMMIREFYSNALDEGEAHIQLTNMIMPAEDTTKFYIEADLEVQKIMSKFDNYFSFRRIPIYTSGKDKLFFANDIKMIFYRKGIRAYDSDMISVFDYDLDNVEVNESRETDSWSVRCKPAILLAKCSDSSIINSFLTDERFVDQSNNLEWNLYWNHIDPIFNDAWIEACKGRTIVPSNLRLWFSNVKNPLFVPSNLFEKLRKNFEGKGMNFPAEFIGEVAIKKQEFALEEQMIIDNALTDLNYIGYKVTKEICKAQLLNSTAPAFNFPKEPNKIFICQVPRSSEEAAKLIVIMNERWNTKATFGSLSNGELYEENLANKYIQLLKEKYTL